MHRSILSVAVPGAKRSMTAIYRERANNLTEVVLYRVDDDHGEYIRGTFWEEGSYLKLERYDNEADAIRATISQVDNLRRPAVRGQREVELDDE